MDLNHKESLINTTMNLLKQGKTPSEITVREICSLSNVGIGSVNYYFQSKDELISICIDTVMTEMLERLKDMLRSLEGLPETAQFFACARWLLSYWSENRNVITPFLFAVFFEEEEQKHQCELVQLFAPFISKNGKDGEEKAEVFLLLLESCFLNQKRLKKIPWQGGWPEKWVGFLLS